MTPPLVFSTLKLVLLQCLDALFLLLRSAAPNKFRLMYTYFPSVHVDMYNLHRKSCSVSREFLNIETGQFIV